MTKDLSGSLIVSLIFVRVSISTLAFVRSCFLVIIALFPTNNMALDNAVHTFQFSLPLVLISSRAQISRLDGHECVPHCLSRDT